MSFKNISRLILALALYFMASTIFAAVSSPLTMLEQTSNSAIAQIKAQKQALKKDPAVAYKIINNTLMPHVDLEGISASAVGSAWTTATPVQKKKFMELFKALLTYTYAAALTHYNDEEIKFYPIRGGYQGVTQVQVKSDILQSEGPSIPVSYRLKLIGSEWKVVDLSIDGISLLENFRTQFAEQLKQGGMDQLIKTLQNHNAQVAEQNLARAKQNS